MLKTFLTNVRKQRVIGSARAINQLQPGWNVSYDSQSISKSKQIVIIILGREWEHSKERVQIRLIRRGL
jgi:hypothetical protein